MPPRNAHALLIGISRYQRQDRVGPLSFAHADALGIAEVLRDPLYGCFPPDNVQVLTDASATHRAIVTSLDKELPRRARGSDLVFLFFAGHGLVEPEAGGADGFLLPHDGDPDELALSGVSMANLAKWLDRVETKALLLCLDCCYSGLSSRGDVLPPGARARGIAIQPRHLEGLSGRNRIVFSACGAEERSLEVDAWKHGLFSKALIDGMKGDADLNQDGWVRFTELYEFVSARVKSEATRLGGRQTPWLRAQASDSLAITRNPRLPAREDPTTSATFELREKARPVGPEAWSRPDGGLESLRQALGSAVTEEREEAARFLLGTRDPRHLCAAFAFLRAEAGTPRHEAARRTLFEAPRPLVLEAIECSCREAAPDARQAGLDAAVSLPPSEELVRLLGRLRRELPEDAREAVERLFTKKKLGLRMASIQKAFERAGSPYEMLHALGEGPLTAAFSATHKALRREVVVRVLNEEVVRQDRIREGFLNVSIECARVVDRHLVNTYDVRDHPEQHLYYVVREFINGITLRKFLENRRVERPRAVRILRQIALALEALHEQGLVHGDLKPSNIFLARLHGGVARVKVGDPGLPSRSQYFFLCESAAYDFRYVAPELLAPEGRAGACSDYYALGVIAYELFAGRPPFTGGDALEVAQKQRFETAAPAIGTPGDRFGALADALVTRLLEKAPARRPQAASELLRALDGLAAALAAEGCTDDTRILPAEESAVSAGVVGTPAPREEETRGRPRVGARASAPVAARLGPPEPTPMAAPALRATPPPAVAASSEESTRVFSQAPGEPAAKPPPTVASPPVQAAGGATPPPLAGDLLPGFPRPPQHVIAGPPIPEPTPPPCASAAPGAAETFLEAESEPGMEVGATGPPVDLGPLDLEALPAEPATEPPGVAARDREYTSGVGLPAMAGPSQASRADRLVEEYEADVKKYRAGPSQPAEPGRRTQEDDISVGDSTLMDLGTLMAPGSDLAATIAPAPPESDEDVQPTRPRLGTAFLPVDERPTEVYRGAAEPAPAAAPRADARRSGAAPPSRAVGTAGGRGDSPYLELAPGTQVGAYRVQSKLGQGGMGVVYRATHQELGRTVALKVLRATGSLSDDTVARAKLEARVLARLSHPNIVQVYDLLYHEGRMVFVLEYVGGGSLASEVRRAGPVPPPRALALAKQVADGLAHAHAEAVIHRDVKPSNILLPETPASSSTREPVSAATTRPPAVLAKLADFGIVKILHEAEVGSGLESTREGMVFGTPQYMSPEAARGATSEIGPYSDVYSLGCTLFFLLTGRPPFESDVGLIDLLAKVATVEPPRPSTRVPGLPRALDDLVVRMLARRPQDRFPDALAVVEAIGKVERSLGSRWLAWFPPPPPSPAPAPSGPPRAAGAGAGWLGRLGRFLFGGGRGE
ncbi:MAG: protein kinase [Planctomycetes bacterium]|nr:protein kinase [Planctomycetota bacterium]